MSDYAIFMPSFKTNMQADIQKIKNDAANKNDGNTTAGCITAAEIQRSIADGTLGPQGGDAQNAWQDVLNHFGQIDVTAGPQNAQRKGGDNLINWDDISHFDLGTA